MSGGIRVAAAVALVLAVGVLATSAPEPPATAAPATGTSTPTPTSGPASKYDCALSIRPADADFTGIDGTASEIGWEGNHQGVATCLGGVFYIQDTLLKNDAIGFGSNYGFGIYDGGPTTWTDADGYLPAQITSFSRDGAKVSITEFCDEVVLGGDAFVAVYSRVAVTNPTDHVVEADPEPSPGLVPLDAAPDAVAAHTSVDHDYVIASDRFGATYPWPSAAALAGAGSFDQHFAHMASFWNHQLAAIAGISVPDRSLDDAYRSGFIYTQIARSGDDLDDGVNGYEAEFNHDVIGILSNLFNEGYFTDADALLLEARNAMEQPGEGFYNDGVWTYSVPWAIYLMKTGDLAFVKQNFDTEGPLGATQPSIEDTAHAMPPGGPAPRGSCRPPTTSTRRAIGRRTTTQPSSAWPHTATLRTRRGHQRSGLGDRAVHQPPFGHQQGPGRDHRPLPPRLRPLLDLPTQHGQPVQGSQGRQLDVPARCLGLGRVAFRSDGQRPGRDHDRRHLRLRFGRLKGKLPPNTFGGFPGDYYSSAYNAGYGTAGLASLHHRDQGILSYEFMITHSQSGPYSWWESSSAPSTQNPWIGLHPATGQGASPTRLGNVTGQRRASRLAGRRAYRRRPRRGPGGRLPVARR